MRRFLRLSAAAVLLGAIAWWAAAGAHRGWSRHSVGVTQVDEVTGIEYQTFEDRFVPGVEIPVAGGALAAGFTFLSFFFKPGRPHAGSAASP